MKSQNHCKSIHTDLLNKKVLVSNSCRKEEGITLIALIVTIIVMLILVTVTINFGINSGLFKKSKEAAFESDIAQIKEIITLKKLELLAENPDTKTFQISMSDLNIPNKLMKKYKDSFTIDNDAKLRYIPEKFTKQEIEWLKNLDITSNIGLKGIIENLIAKNQSYYVSEYGTYDYKKLIYDTLIEKPDTKIMIGKVFFSTEINYPIVQGGGTVAPDEIDYFKGRL